MTLFACGINHSTTPVTLRERVAFAPDQAKIALQELINVGAANEAMILSTCNRVEIYTDTRDGRVLKDWIANNLPLPLDPYWYIFQEKQAVSHIMRVASGLDSMILGENQIFGQMKEAYCLAKETGTLGSRLQRLLQRAFNVSKQVRHDTNISANPVTLGYAALTLAKRIFSDLSKARVMLIGAGETVELTALHLLKQGITRFIIASRSSERAQALANRLSADIIAMADIPLFLQEADIVISATASDLPILGKGAVERAIKARKHKPIFMVDLAVPRDIEPEVSALEDIYLYNIDDLKSIIEENQQSRQAAAWQAESIIELQAEHFIKDLQSLDANNLIKQFRENLFNLSQLELQRAYTRLDQGIDPKAVLNQLTHNLVNKLSHTPCTQLKQAAFDGKLDVLMLAKELLNLD